MAVQLSIFDEFNLFEPSPNTGQSPKLELENKPPSKENTLLEANLTSLEETVYLGQKVKIKIPEDKESEEYFYLKYYCAASLNRVGEICTISKSEKGEVICEVNFHGEKFLFHQDGLILL